MRGADERRGGEERMGGKDGRRVGERRGKKGERGGRGEEGRKGKEEGRRMLMILFSEHHSGSTRTVATGLLTINFVSGQGLVPQQGPDS